MINLKFLVRDADITYYDEWHYIYITLREVLKILIINFNTYLKNNYKKL
jgi:hypothetical protein